MQIPIILVESKKEFIKRRRIAIRRRLLHYLLSKFMGISALLINFFMASEIFNTPIKILAAVSGTLIAFNEIFAPQKISIHYQILQLKFEAAIRQIETKIGEFEEYFRGVDAEDSSIPEQFSATTLFNIVNKIYREIDDIKLSHLTGSSYEKISAAG